MANERIVGIDFGTSTSVIRVKSYTQNGKPVTDRLDTRAVTFNHGSTTVPTLIQRINDADYFGYDAQVRRTNAETFRNFKLNLQSTDSAEREAAEKLAKKFFKFLHKEYIAQSSGGHLGSSDETENTIVSYPVKWSDKTRDFMIQAAKDAGFSNVTGMDEAEAAIRAVTVQCEDFLKKKQYLQNGKPSNILLIDMGAGTTDLVLCRFTPGERPKNEILCVWPKDGQVFFGGKEIDEILKTYIAPKIPDNHKDTILKSVGLDEFKSWKEEIVSPALWRRESVTEFNAVDTLLQFIGAELDAFKLNRSEFESIAAEYLNNFPKLIKGCLESAGMSGDDIDLVLVTGGHSQWYFVKKFLTGKMNEFDSISLGKITADPERVISVTLPQETVALGLVYSKISGSVAEDTSAVREYKSTKKIETPVHDAKPSESKQYTISEIKEYAKTFPIVQRDSSLQIGYSSDIEFFSYLLKFDPDQVIFSFRDSGLRKYFIMTGKDVITKYDIERSRECSLSFIKDFKATGNGVYMNYTDYKKGLLFSHHPPELVACGSREAMREYAAFFNAMLKYIKNGKKAD